MGLRHILNPLVCYEIRAETLEWDILNPDRLITRGEQALFNLEIKKKRRSRIDLDIHSKVFSLRHLILNLQYFRRLGYITFLIL